MLLGVMLCLAHKIQDRLGKIARLARAINELTGSDNYDPRVRTNKL